MPHSAVGRVSRTAIRVGLALGLTGLVVGCGSEPPVTAADMIHVHDLIVDDGQPTYVATHAGLFELVDGRAELRGEGVDDLMAAVRTDAPELLASGHPDLRAEALRVDGRPPLLGIVVRDGDEWEPRALLGEADFHALAEGDRLLFGADGTSGYLLVSEDDGQSWSRRGAVEVVALAVDPESDENLAGVGLDGRLLLSDDGGVNWRDGSVPDALDAAWTAAGLVVLTEGGDVIGATGDREMLGSVSAAAAITSDGDTLWALVPPAELLRSIDGGRTWMTSR